MVAVLAIMAVTVIMAAVAAVLAKLPSGCGGGYSCGSQLAVAVCDSAVMATVAAVGSIVDGDG